MAYMHKHVATQQSTTSLLQVTGSMLPQLLSRDQSYSRASANWSSRAGLGCCAEPRWAAEQVVALHAVDCRAVDTCYFCIDHTVSDIDGHIIITVIPVHLGAAAARPAVSKKLKCILDAVCMSKLHFVATISAIILLVHRQTTNCAAVVFVGYTCCCWTEAAGFAAARAKPAVGHDVVVLTVDGIGAPKEW